ncbi:argininosuccinate lyase [Pelagivirga sediminicola]|uniref:Argininosuccinate lyase n=1 Tax=Pelagivirga sediminicola TaxID=2170575 RepID=A0A2T7G4K5_9RHOB|nr:argininosuccinate lyase [Pelagivirga sediminicola]PVA09363.1 argininosuccinate lyase [Pelagivirga sediminicola]
MKYAIALAALAALTACGVDGAPVRPSKNDSALARPPNASAKPEPGKWIGGNVSVHTAAVL